MRALTISLSCIATCLAVTCANIAGADEIKWQIVTPFPDNTKPQKALTREARKFSRTSEGRLNLQFVGTPVDTKTSVMQRFTTDPTISAALIANFEYTQLVPDANLYSQSFAFNDAHEVDAIRLQIDVALVSHLQHDNFVVLGISGVGFAHLMSREKIVGMNDFAGKTVWLPEVANLAAASLSTYSLTLQSSDPDWRNFPAASWPDLMLHAPIALIIDRSIPRFQFLLQPPIHYGYLLFIVKRSHWESLQAADQKLIQAYVQSQLSGLEKNAKKMSVRAMKILHNGGMKSISLSRIDTDLIRRTGVGENITPSLQAQFQMALDDFRRAADTLDE